VQRSFAIGALALASAGAGACGGSSSGGHVDAASGDSGGGFVLTSTAFVEGGAIPAVHTCSAGDLSPPLAWSGAPSGAAGFAVVLTDITLSPPLIHWVLYDIPPAVTSLPAGIENVYAPAIVAGAHQTFGYDDKTRGYLGPCPPAKHVYQYAVYPVIARPLPGSFDATTRDDAFNGITAHDIGRPATLTASYTP
jgi:Raf kinase inhibitor-like YbhB/YbcL family protein